MGDGEGAVVSSAAAGHCITGENTTRCDPAPWQLSNGQVKRDSGLRCVFLTDLQYEATLKAFVHSYVKYVLAICLCVVPHIDFIDGLYLHSSPKGDTGVNAAAVYSPEKDGGKSKTVPVC